MKTTPHAHLAAAAFLLALTPAVAPLRAEPPGTIELAVSGKNVLAVNENEQTKAIDAAGRDVTINGNRNKLTLRGECHALTLSGNGNTVEVETVTSISLPGNHNQVAWGKAAGGEKPQITDLGNGNSVTRRAAR